MAFEHFVGEVEPRLRRTLVVTYGGEVGLEATADALAYAWEHWDRLASCPNPAGYLFRVGQTSARRQRRPSLTAWPPVPPEEPNFEPGLLPALIALSEQQRAVVMLVHGYGWSLREVAAMLDLSLSTVRNHLDRALSRLRHALEVDHVG
jgi:DNA-directed RNA polymerase specialized sigma24 family protein